tara:strand:- start:4881 stop:5774 length:894 start_codon:yes stop_codon:yes gene_type:complete
MSLSDSISVFVATHIIRADRDPYIENQMIVETIRQSREKLDLKNVQYYVYPDAKFNRTHPDLMKKYYDYLESIKSLEGLKDTKINIMKDTRETMRSNWLKFIQEDCETPYMLFLEHDWGFTDPIDVDKIVNIFEKNEQVGYIKFNRFPHDNNMRNLGSHNNWDWIFEQEGDLDLELPLFKISFFSGNPHIARVKKCKEFYIPEMIKHCPPESSRGTSHLEKDMKKAELFWIDSFRKCGVAKQSGHIWPLSRNQSVGSGCRDCEQAIRKYQKEWGLFMLGDWGDSSRVFHLGEWCRKE